MIDKKDTVETKKVKFIDANSLYGYAMSQLLP